METTSTSAISPLSKTYVILAKAGGNYEITSESIKYEGGVVIFQDYGTITEPHAIICIDSIFGVIRKDIVEKMASKA